MKLAKGDGLIEAPIRGWSAAGNRETHALSRSALLVHHLPNELLAEIISLAANSHKQTHPESPAGWIFLTHVCRLWREAALQHATLWREIDCEKLDRAKVFLQRSQSTMVHI